MTVTADPSTGPVSASASPSAGQLWRSARGPVVVALVVVLGALVLAVVAGGPPGGRLDPRSPAPTGSRAVVEILRDQGVTVDVATTTSRVGRLAGQGSTVVVVDPELLAESQVQAVRDTGSDLVVVEAGRPERFVPGVTTHGTSPTGVRAPGCRLAPARRAGTADAGAVAYDVDPQVRGARLCYASDGRPSLVRARVDGRSVVLLGSGVPLTNDRLDDEGNAALALGLLGSHEHLVWYLPSLSDVPADTAQTSIYDLVPTGVWWAVVQLGVAVLLLALWRARRLGPVVAEPLPVVVQAAETVEGRARLYRRSSARGTAAENLRAARRVRLARMLGLPSGASPSALVDAVAARSGRPAVDVGTLLYGAAPADDAALVRLADDLDALDQEVRRP